MYTKSVLPTAIELVMNTINAFRQSMQLDNNYAGHLKTTYKFRFIGAKIIHYTNEETLRGLMKTSVFLNTSTALTLKRFFFEWKLSNGLHLFIRASTKVPAFHLRMNYYKTYLARLPLADHT